MSLKQSSVAALMLFVCGCFQPAVDCDQTRSSCAGDDAGSLGPIASYKITFRCTAGCTEVNTHTMTITRSNPATGAFSGTGVFDVDATYTWNVTGTITGPNLSFRLVYTGTNPGYTCNMTGTIDASGAPRSGVGTSSEAQSFTWTATRRP